jgi:outer membrane protein, heavy metal efflux system
MNRRAILAALLTLCAVAHTGLARGADAPADTTGPRTLGEYLTLARAANPALKSVAAGATAARERIGVARGYPDPAILYGYYFDADESGHVPSMKGRSELTLMQEIPFFGKRGMRGEIASREAAVVSSAGDEALLELEYQVKVGFFELARTHELARVLDQERALVEQMRDVSFSRYSSGTAEQYEVLKLDMTIAQIDDQITMNEHDLAMATAHLNEWIGRDAASTLPPPRWAISGASELERVAVVDSAIAHRPEVASARAEIDAAETARRLAGREYFPDFVLGLQWEFGGEKDALGDQMGDSWEVMAGMSLPIWIGKRRAQSREAEARAAGAQYNLEAVHLRVARDVEESRHGLMSARERLERFDREILPRAEQAFRSAEAGYRAGRADLLDYLDSERMWLAMRKEYYGVAAELGAQTAALERALGTRE